MGLVFGVLAQTHLPSTATGTSLWIYLIGSLGVVLTAVVTWRIARRKSSGRIDTSEATDLWGESKAIREDLRNEANALRAEVAAARAEAAACRTQVDVERSRADRAQGEVASLREEVSALRKEVATLRRTLQTKQNKPRSQKGKR
jgi:Skp family chaperone for outer membrane proteins